MATLTAPVCFCFLVLLILASSCGGPSSRPTPSLVLITYDALRADSLGYAGHPIIQTPSLDGLVERSHVFTQAVSSFFGTTASMPSLMSGLYPNLQETDSWSIATWHGFSDLNDPDETQGVTRNLHMLAEIMQERGYVTACFTTNPNLSRREAFTQGCDHYESFGDFFREARQRKTHRLQLTYPPAGLVVDRVIEWISSHEEQPFFVWLHLMDPHSPYLPPEPFDRLEERVYSSYPDLRINIGLYHQIANQRRPVPVPVPLSELFGMTEEAADLFVEHVRSLYDGEIRYADRQTGRLLTFMDERGLMDRTLVVATADHGEELYDHSMFIHHSHHPAMEELIRIPLLIYLPPFFDAEGHQRIDQQVRMIDIAPTLLDYLDMSAEADHMDGVSLRPLIEGRPLAEQPAFVGAIDFNIVRTSRLKYRRVKRAFREYPEGEALFAIAEDPLETTNVAARFPEELARLRAVHDEIVRHLVERSDTAAPVRDQSPELDAEAEERLRNLGYLD